MIAIVAKDHTAYEEWLNEHYTYIGDTRDIQRLNPNQVSEILFAEGFDQHPIYFTDAFLKFQCEVAASNFKPQPKKAWWRPW